MRVRDFAAEKGLVYVTSRRAYVGNYLIAAIFIVLLVVVMQKFNLSFTLFPRQPKELISTISILGFLAVISFLFEEPVIERLFRKYIVTGDEVIKLEGLIRKKRLAIAIGNIADVRVYKSFLGRLLNYGDVEVHGFKTEFVMKGMHNPEEIQRIIQNKINMFRRAVVSRRMEREENGE
jgi:uncharacterized membrane protein YdbT with pleckstrin-like domain